MHMVLYAIYDSKAEAHLQPFFLPNKAVAIRAAADCVNDPNHQFAQHPEDYALVELATFDNLTGDITPNHSLITGLARLQNQPELDLGPALEAVK